MVPAQTQILIVEDDEDTAYLLTEILTKQDWAVEHLIDGQAALDWLAQDKAADLVLLDGMLPYVDGFEVCRQMRQRYSSTHLPILMITALGHEVDNRVRALKAGANDVLPKPYYPTELLARIEGLLSIKVAQGKDDTQEIFASYTSEILRREAMVNPDLLKKRMYRHAVILFADLRGFTSLTEDADPNEIVSLLDDFFYAMMSVIKEHGGVVLDLKGDELLAGFNLPHDLPLSSYLAVQAAIEMQRMFRHLQRAWQKRGLPVGLGIGIHQGQVLVGNLGNDELMRYTVLGKVVNYAHRLVDIARDGEIVVSEAIYTANGKVSCDVQVETLPNVQLKGIRGDQQVHRFNLQLAPQ